ncbi:hypothetical protein N9P29_00815 [bacterium]|nr:hypothetical protein [bacterium]
MRSVENTALYLMLIAGVSPVLYFFPSVEHFPWGLLCLMLFHRGVMASFLLVIAMIVYFIFGYYAYEVSGESAGIATIFILMNMISPLFFFRGNEARIGRAARNVFWLYVIVGVLQMARILIPVEDIIGLFIARFNGGPIGGGSSYRGVQMLETEPARASFQILVLFILATALSEGWKEKLLGVMVASQIILIGSTTGLLLTGIYLVFRFSGQAIRSPHLIVMFIAATFIIYPSFRENPKTNLLIELYQDEGTRGAKTALAAASGGRFLGMLNAIDAIADKPLGHGPDPAFFEGVKVEVDDYSVPGYLTRASARPVSSTLTYLYVYGFPMFFLLLYAARKTAGRLRAVPGVLFVGVLSVLYSPPASEITLLLLLSVIYKVNQKTAVAQSSEARHELPSLKEPNFA